MQIIETNSHPQAMVDPFGQLPCEHTMVLVHITNGESIGDDLLECPTCDYVVTLRDLYAAVRMPAELMPTS